MLVRFKDHPEPKPPGMIKPETENKVMHARLQIGDSIVMASDGRCTGSSHFSGINLSLTAPDKAAAEKLFNALADGGTVDDALQRDVFLPRFRYGRRPLRRALDDHDRAVRRPAAGPVAIESSI